MEEGRDHLAVVEGDLAGGRVDRGRHARGLRGDSAVDLAAHVGVEVEGLARGAVRERVRPRRDGLGLERLRRPLARHLARHDPGEVLLHADDVDRVQPPAADGHLELTAIRRAELERRRPGQEDDRAGQVGGRAVDVTRSFGPSATEPAGSA